MELGPIFGLALGLVALDRGIAAKRGTWRGFERLYRNNQMPRLARNLAFTLVPIGFTFIVGLLAGLSATAGSRTLSITLFLAVPVMFLLVVAIAMRPPTILKPKWVVDEEKVGGVPSMPLQGLDVILASVLVLAGIITAASLAFLLLRA